MLGALILSVIAAAASDLPLKTIEDRVAEFGEVVRERLEPRFRAAGIPYPPQQVTLVGLKQERMLEIYARDFAGEFRFICSYRVLAASGASGPKLREGDHQVPEGVYCIRKLNPNSRFHLALWLDYPNEFDLARAAEDGRIDPGGEIMIHGGELSRGCLAVGDAAAEDLFLLAALTGIENLTVILAPWDFRKDSGVKAPNESPNWTRELYARIKFELLRYPGAGL